MHWVLVLVLFWAPAVWLVVKVEKMEKGPARTLLEMGGGLLILVGLVTAVSTCMESDRVAREMEWKAVLEKMEPKARAAVLLARDNRDRIRKELQELEEQIEDWRYFARKKQEAAEKEIEPPLRFREQLFMQGALGRLEEMRVREKKLQWELQEAEVELQRKIQMGEAGK